MILQYGTTHSEKQNRREPGVDAERGFRDYIAAFNRGDTDAYGAHYADDVILVIADHTVLRGRQAIFDFYAGIRAGTERTIDVVDVLARADLLAAELVSEFLATRDLPDFASGPMRAGDRLLINSFVFYDLEHGHYGASAPPPIAATSAGRRSGSWLSATPARPGC